MGIFPFSIFPSLTVNDANVDFYVWFLEENRYIVFNKTYYKEFNDARRKNWFELVKEESIEVDPKSLLTYENEEVRIKVKQYLNS